MADDCQHDFKRYASTGGLYMFTDNPEEAPPLIVIDRCDHCRVEQKRPATEEEKAEDEKKAILGSQIHTQWHEVSRMMGDESGYPLLNIIDEIADKFPDHVHVASVDDGHHCGSSIMFVEHRSDEYYWGTSAVVVPQCTGEEPLQFFMYPGHMQSVLQCLAEIQRHDLPSKFEYSYGKYGDELKDPPDPWVVVKKSQVKDPETLPMVENEGSDDAGER